MNTTTVRLWFIRAPVKAQGERTTMKTKLKKLKISEVVKNDCTLRGESESSCPFPERATRYPQDGQWLKEKWTEGWNQYHLESEIKV